MSRFVQRIDGKVVAHFARHQPGLADEELADDHPDILAFDNPPPTTEAIRKAELEALQTTIDLADKFKNATPAQIRTYLANNWTTITNSREVMAQLLIYIASKV